MAEVLARLVELDRRSILGDFRRFRPTLPGRHRATGGVTVVDL